MNIYKNNNQNYLTKKNTNTYNETIDYYSKKFIIQNCQVFQNFV